MIERETFEDLDLALKNIKQNLLQFRGVSFLLVGDFLELLPVNQKSVFMKPSKGSYNFMNWLKLFGRAVIQILLSYLIEFEKASTQMVI